MYLPPAMERAGRFLSYKQPHRFVLRLFLGKKSSESFLESALYRSGEAFIKDVCLRRTHTLRATQPLPGEVADKLEWGCIRNPWLWVPKVIKERHFLVTQEQERGGFTGPEWLSWIIWFTGNSPTPISDQFFVLPLVSSSLPVGYFELLGVQTLRG